MIDGNIAALEEHEKKQYRQELISPVCGVCHERITNQTEAYYFWQTGDWVCDDCISKYIKDNWDVFADILMDDLDKEYRKTIE